MARARQAFQASVYEKITHDEALRQTGRKIWGYMVMLGYIQAWDDPDYPLVLSHDYGCQVTA
jgi:hypothetical protein